MKELVSINLQDTDNIRVENGLIKFDEYELFKAQATELSGFISSIEVNDENIKLTKKVIAKVNKQVKALEDHRIAIKKEVLIPYDTFEKQVKEIVGIVKDADTLVRSQIRELEEIERSNKAQLVEEIWDDRYSMYDFEFLKLDDFLTPQHLNKSTTMKSIEADMVTFLEKVNQDLGVIAGLPNKLEVFREYIETLDLSEAMRLVQEHDERQSKAEVIINENIDKLEYSFKVFSSEDMELTKSLLTKSNIVFQIC